MNDEDKNLDFDERLTGKGFGGYGGIVMLVIITSLMTFAILGSNGYFK